MYVKKTITAAEYKEMTQKNARTKKKYGNKTKTYTSVQGFTRTYDSIKEANWAEELDWRIKAGEVKEWVPQWKIDITIKGRHWRNYYIDFKVVNSDGSVEYHEVKGFATEVWKMKWDALMFQKDEILNPGEELIVIK